MKKIVLVIALLLLSTPLYAKDSKIKDSAESRIMAANKYLDAMPPKDMITDSVHKISKQIPEDKQKLFQDLMLSHLDLEKLTIIIRDSMVKHFTTEELEALADFYGSPVGKSAMAKFGDYMAEAMPQIQTIMAEAAQKTKEQIEK